jgi:hypothetical protein
MLFKFPEGMMIRRLAAGLATSLTATTADNGELDMALSTRLYMRRLPWFGTKQIQRGNALLEDCTVGQYFAQFSFSGIPIPTFEGTDHLDTEEPATQPFNHVRRYGI